MLPDLSGRYPPYFFGVVFLNLFLEGKKRDRHRRRKPQRWEAQELGGVTCRVLKDQLTPRAEKRGLFSNKQKESSELWVGCGV